MRMNKRSVNARRVWASTPQIEDDADFTDEGAFLPENCCCRIIYLFFLLYGNASTAGLPNYILPVPECSVVPDVEMLAKADQGEEGCYVALKANVADEPTHRDLCFCAVRIAIFPQPLQAGCMRDGTGCLNQRVCIHIQVFATMTYTQEAGTSEEITDEVFES